MQKHHNTGADTGTRNEKLNNQQAPVHPSKRKRKTKKRLRLVVLILLLLIIAGCGAGWYMVASPLQSHQRILSTGSNQTNQSLDLSQQNRINMLLIGTDTRPGEQLNASNTDSLIFTSLDMVHNRIEMLSIPRDSLVQIPGHGKDKINTAMAIGGIKLTEQVVADLIGQPIDYYAITKFGGLKDVVDTIGGVTINVDRDMYYLTGDKQDGVINLKKGLQTLNGTQALQYVRFREDALGDIQRTMRQQTFLKALKDKLLSVETIPKLPWLIPQLFKTVDTDLPQSDALKLASRAKVYSEQPLIHETLPGSFIEINGISYWEVNTDQAKYAAHEFFESGKVVQNPVQDPSDTENWQPPVQQQSNSNSGTGTSNQSNTESTNDTQNTSGQSDIQNSNPQPTAQGQDAIARDTVNVRTGPGTDYAIITSLSGGDHVRVLQQVDTWDKVQLSNGQIGYVAGYLLSLQ